MQLDVSSEKLSHLSRRLLVPGWSDAGSTIERCLSIAHENSKSRTPSQEAWCFQRLEYSHYSGVQFLGQREGETVQRLRIVKIQRTNNVGAEADTTRVTLRKLEMFRSDATRSQSLLTLQSSINAELYTICFRFCTALYSKMRPFARLPLHAAHHADFARCNTRRKHVAQHRLQPTPAKNSMVAQSFARKN